MEKLPHNLFISELAYSIGFAENEYFLIPESTSPIFDYTRPKLLNCKENLLWGGIHTLNRINSGLGGISQKEYKISELIQSINFEYDLGIYSRIKLEVWCFNLKKPIIVFAWKNQYFAKFKEHKDVITYLFAYLPQIIKCKTIEELKEIFPQEGDEI